jgi:hypothetical protein
MSNPANPEADLVNKTITTNKYPDPQLLSDKIEEYFEHCETEKKKYTVAGLVYFLGYSNKQSISDLRGRKDPMYGWLIDRARLRIEDNKNSQLLKPGQPTAGYIFDLKNNHGWRDRQEITGEGGGPVFVYESAIKREKVEETTEDGEFEDII